MRKRRRRAVRLSEWLGGNSFRFRAALHDASVQLLVLTKEFREWSFVASKITNLSQFDPGGIFHGLPSYPRRMGGMARLGECVRSEAGWTLKDDQAFGRKVPTR